MGRALLEFGRRVRVPPASALRCGDCRRVAELLVRGLWRGPRNIVAGVVAPRAQITPPSEINGRDDFFNKCRCSGFRNSLQRRNMKCRCNDLLESGLSSAEQQMSYFSCNSRTCGRLGDFFCSAKSSSRETAIVRLPASTTLVILIAVSFVTPRTDVGLPHTSDRAERRENQSSRKRYGWAKCKCFL